MNAVTQPPTPFEHTTCARCCGTGTYSYSQQWGTTCFKCGFKPGVPGRGWLLTKRGAAASAYMTDLLSRRADEIQPGDSVRLPGRSRFAVVQRTYTELTKYRIGDGPWQIARQLTLDTGSTAYSFGQPDELVRVSADAATKAAALEQALAFQATLTAKGTPRKR